MGPSHNKPLREKGLRVCGHYPGIKGMLESGEEGINVPSKRAMK